MTLKPIMPIATAVWLVDNTTLSFRQIAAFCGLHELEVQGIADDEVAVGIQGLDPIVNHQLDFEEIKLAEANRDHDLQLKDNPAAEGEKRRLGSKYTPLSKRVDKPAAIAWLIKNHPDLTTRQIGKLIGSTKITIDSVRDRTHWNINNIQPTDPVSLGLCRQIELDEVVQRASERVAKEKESEVRDEGKSLLSTEESTKDDSKLQSPVFDLGDFSFDKIDGAPNS